MQRRVWGTGSEVLGLDDAVSRDHDWGLRLQLFVPDAGLRFIVGSRVTKAPKDLESHFRWHGTAFTDGQIAGTGTSCAATPMPRRSR